ncbi:hypothetical protein DPMN_170129 [Dreissena polymorpha]|uniref:Uncharacterized protein n=1 Tax=Dreissena polymorpha TaxID=45954 RepID=A0A9D4DVM8_DREPO|nr:hypothetical protein DPMN_170129 [Dreissena polymorpha]
MFKTPKTVFMTPLTVFTTPRHCSQFPKTEVMTSQKMFTNPHTVFTTSRQCWVCSHTHPNSVHNPLDSVHDPSESIHSPQTVFTITTYQIVFSPPPPLRQCSRPLRQSSQPPASVQNPRRRTAPTTPSVHDHQDSVLVN